jgi:hypothetical protein
LVREPGRKKPFEVHRWEHIIEMDLTESGWQVIGWIHVTENEN